MAGQSPRAPRRSLFDWWTQVILPDGRVERRQMLPRPPVRGALGMDAMGPAPLPVPEVRADSTPGWFARSSFKNPADYDGINAAMRAGRTPGFGAQNDAPGRLVMKPGRSESSNVPAQNTGTFVSRMPLAQGQPPLSVSASADLDQRFKERMIPHEGDRSDVYRDSLGKPTVGIGHLVRSTDNLKLGDRISDDQKEAFWRRDSAKALEAGRRQAAEAGIDDDDFVLALADVNFQLGSGWSTGPKSFKPTWDLIVQGKYQEAADHLRRSRWYHQTPDRVENFRNALLELPSKQR